MDRTFRTKQITKCCRIELVIVDMAVIVAAQFSFQGGEMVEIPRKCSDAAVNRKRWDRLGGIVTHESIAKKQVCARRILAMHTRS